MGVVDAMTGSVGVRGNKESSVELDVDAWTPAAGGGGGGASEAGVGVLLPSAGDSAICKPRKPSASSDGLTSADGGWDVRGDVVAEETLGRRGMPLIGADRASGVVAGETAREPLRECVRDESAEEPAVDGGFRGRMKASCDWVGGGVAMASMASWTAENGMMGEVGRREVEACGEW